MELYYETVKSGNTTLRVSRFRKKNIIKKTLDNEKVKTPYHKWSKLKRPREAAKRYFSKIEDSNSLEIIQALDFMVNKVKETNFHHSPRGSAISKIKKKYRVQGRVGKEANMYLGMYESREEAQRVIDGARKNFRDGMSEESIRQNWKSLKKRDTEKKNTIKYEQYCWECPQCSKILKSKAGHKGHLEIHSFKKSRIIFKKKL